MGWELLPALIGGAFSIFSGAQGNKAAKEANQRQAELDEFNRDFMEQGMGMVGDMQNQAQSFLDGGGKAGELMDKAVVGGQNYSNDMSGLMEMLLGVGDGGASKYGQALAKDPGAQFDFTSGSNIMNQAMSTFGDFAKNTRDQAGDQAAKSFTAGGGALDAALASRGISRDSGVAGGAIGDMAVQQGQALAGVERDLANMGGQLGLDATKFDVGRVLQEQGLKSNFELGKAGLRSQNLLGAGNLALSGAGLESSNIAQAGNMRGQAYTIPLSMEQDMYQQNQLAPFMQMQSMMNPMDLLSMAFGGMNQATQTAGNNAAQGGAGMGAGVSNLVGQMFDYLSNKNKSPTTSYQPSSENG